MRNVCVEFAGQLGKVALFGPIKHLFNFSQVLVSLKHSLLVELTKRKSLGIIPDLHHTLFDQFHVKYKGDQALLRFVKLRQQLCLLTFFFLLCFFFFLGLTERHLDLRVPFAGLFAACLRILLHAQLERAQLLGLANAINADATVPSPEGIRAGGGMAEDLRHVELVMILFEIVPHQVAREGCARRIHHHGVVLGLRDEKVHEDSVCR